MKIWFNNKLAQDLSKIASVEADGLAGELAPTQNTAAAQSPATPSRPTSKTQPVAPQQDAATHTDQRLRVVTRKPEDIGAADHKSLYREILAGMYDAVIVTDPNGRVIDCNDRASEFFGFAKSELWDQPIETLIHSVTKQLIDRLHQTVTGNRHVMLDTSCHTKDGIQFAAEVAVSGIHLASDNDLVFFIRNTEKRHRAQQRLRSEHNAVMASAAAFALCDKSGAITFSNPALAAMWGFPCEADVEGGDIRELWSDSAAFSAILDSAMAGTRWSGSLTAVASDGRQFDVVASISPDNDIHGRTIGIVCSFHEVAK